MKVCLFGGRFDGSERGIGLLFMGAITVIINSAQRLQSRPQYMPNTHSCTDSLTLLPDCVELLRLRATKRQDRLCQKELGQFLTPEPVAALMASMLGPSPPSIHILDPGAGVGSLFTACIVELLHRPTRPEHIKVTAYEVDPPMIDYLHQTMELCRQTCTELGIQFEGCVEHADFIERSVDALTGGLFAVQQDYTIAIINPPYRKIHSDSTARKLLRQVGIETSNLYTGFVGLTLRLLQNKGEIITITPRSFCNGPYFREFRRDLLNAVALNRLHIYESRSEAFTDDDVLQENVILHGVKGAVKPLSIAVTMSSGSEDESLSFREVDYEDVIHPRDPDSFIRIVSDELGGRVADMMDNFRYSLASLNIQVSTGRVVEFRAREYLRQEPGDDTAPLIYPLHFGRGRVVWPQDSGRKPNAIIAGTASADLLIPNAPYVLLKRLTSKDEKKRLVAVVHDPADVPGDLVGFENHINYFHSNGSGLGIIFARGLAAFLNCTLVDSYFRQFNGHTQVNATDLRTLKYPSAEQLEMLGKQIPELFPTQEELDELIRKVLLGMSDKHNDPVLASRRIDEAKKILNALGLPKTQQNDRSAMTLLSLLNIEPATPWSQASQPLRGITPMMEFMAENYGKTYQPNSRESVRRFTVHQFIDAGLIVQNPDDPQRPINSGKTVYQIDSVARKLIQTYGGKEWTSALETYLATVQTLKERYARERKMQRLPVRISPDEAITLSPGGQNILVKEILEQFAPFFTPGCEIIDVGDTQEKQHYFKPQRLADLGVVVDEHGKMPDAVIYYGEKNWLILVEAVTSHGPVDPKRRLELEKLFAGSKAGLVYLTAFLTRKTMVKYLSQISWETEVWIAESPTHLIHFNGERFLGPYEQIP